MSQDFELKFDEYKNNNPAEKGSESDPDQYPSGGNVRNLAFFWPDGKMQFFNYSYLITCTYTPEQGNILLEFSTHQVELKGQKLEQIFNEIMVQSIKVIRCGDKRYQANTDQTKPYIIEMTCTAKT